MHRPSWFRDGKVLVSSAETAGINKDGEELYLVDQATGQRTDTINDELARDVTAVLQGGDTPTVHWVDAEKVKATGVVVPVYYDERPIVNYRRQLQDAWPGFTSASLGELIVKGDLVVQRGHGSPSADLRSGNIPYIKVSDLRAGQININPTNRVTEIVARRYWGSDTSGLEPYDLITPARTSKNIGDFAVLMPGQERIVLTKEMLILRPSQDAPFDSFFLLWAMSLKVVRDQWKRIVFMQTNREDTGNRYREIQIPLAPSLDAAAQVAKPFRAYYEGTALLRKKFLSYLTQDEHHHVFLASVEAAEEAAEEAVTLQGDPNVAAPHDGDP